MRQLHQGIALMVLADMREQTVRDDEGEWEPIRAACFEDPRRWVGRVFDWMANLEERMGGSNCPRVSWSLYRRLGLACALVSESQEG